MLDGSDSTAANMPKATRSNSGNINFFITFLHENGIISKIHFGFPAGVKGRPTDIEGLSGGQRPGRV
jgi:hypothetical protein